MCTWDILANFGKQRELPGRLEVRQNLSVPCHSFLLASIPISDVSDSPRRPTLLPCATDDPPWKRPFPRRLFTVPRKNPTVTPTVWEPLNPTRPRFRCENSHCSSAVRCRATKHFRRRDVCPKVREFRSPPANNTCRRRNNGTDFVLHAESNMTMGSVEVRALARRRELAVFAWKWRWVGILKFYCDQLSLWTNCIFSFV